MYQSCVQQTFVPFLYHRLTTDSRNIPSPLRLEHVFQMHLLQGWVVGSLLSSKDMIRGKIPNCDLASHVITYWKAAMMNENTKILGAHVLLLQIERHMAENGVAINVMSVFDMILDNVVLLPFAFPFSMHVHQWVLVPISISTLTLYFDMFFMMKAFISLIAMI